jgi:hypothetical protein
MVVEILGGQSAAASPSTLGRGMYAITQYADPVTFQGWPLPATVAPGRGG